MNPFLKHIDNKKIELNNQFNSLISSLLGAYEGNHKRSDTYLSFAPCTNTSCGLNLRIDYNDMKIVADMGHLYIKSSRRDSDEVQQEELTKTEKLFKTKAIAERRIDYGCGDQLEVRFSFDKVTPEVIKDMATLMELRDFKPQQTKTYNYAL